MDEVNYPEYDAAKEALQAAMVNFIQATSDMRDDRDGVMRETVLVEGWAAYAEYSTRTLMLNEETGNVVIRPDDQAASHSRGLFSFGVDAFTTVKAV